MSFLRSRKCFRSRSLSLPATVNSNSNWDYCGIVTNECLFIRWQILEGILCSVRRMPARASLLSQQRTMNYLKCAFSPQSQVSQGLKVWQAHAHNTHMHTTRYTHAHAHNTHMHTTRYTHAYAHNTHVHIPYRNFLIVKFTPFLLMVCLSSRSHRSTWV